MAQHREISAATLREIALYMDWDRRGDKCSAIHLDDNDEEYEAMRILGLRADRRDVTVVIQPASVNGFLYVWVDPTPETLASIYATAADKRGEVWANR